MGNIKLLGSMLVLIASGFVIGVCVSELRPYDGDKYPDWIWYLFMVIPVIWIYSAYTFLTDKKDKTTN